MPAAKHEGTLCRYHDPLLAPLTHQRNKIARDRYWARWRAEKAAAQAAPLAVRLYFRSTLKRCDDALRLVGQRLGPTNSSTALPLR